MKPLTLITGVAGFIGSQLAEKLILKGYRVIGIDNFTDYYPRLLKERNIKWLRMQDNFVFHEMDISTDNIEAKIGHLDDSITIFHLAAHPGVRSNSLKDSEAHIRDNIQATYRLLEWSRNKKIIKFVFSSSSSIYGDSLNLPLRETEVPKPLSQYGLAKLTSENLCSLYWYSFGLPIVILRFFTVYGPRQRPDMALYKFIKALSNGETFELYGDGNQTRDFTYIDDVIEGICLSIKAPSGEVFNIGSGKTVTLQKVIALLEDILHKRADMRIMNQLQVEMKNTWADINKAKINFGYNPKYSFDKGIIKQIEWMRKSKV